MSNPQHEPTMEEILASIRKIISEDAPEAVAPAPVAAAPAPPLPPPAPEPVMEEDVLELTQEFVEAEPIHPMPLPEPVLPTPEPEPDVVFQAVEEPAPASEPEPAPAAALHDGIFSERTRSAMEETFAKIPDIAPEAPATPRPAPTETFKPAHGPTIESVFERAVADSFEPVLRKYLADNAAGVIEGMKPVIREWMDEHFPALLEGAVRAEAERVARSHIKR